MKIIYPLVSMLSAITTENNPQKTAIVENVVRWHTEKWPSDARNSLLRAVFLFMIEGAENRFKNTVVGLGVDVSVEMK